MKIEMLSINLRIIISTILLLLLFSACSMDTEDSNVPLARFYVKGVIVGDDPDRTPISGANVALGIPYKHLGEDLVYYMDSITTKEDGNFTLSILEFPQPQIFSMKIEDKQSGQDIRFELKKLTIDFVNPSFANGNGSWYAGETVKDLGQVEVKLIKEELQENEDEQIISAQ